MIVTKQCFPGTQGQLTGYFYSPRNDHPTPGLVLCHGFSALMAHGLDQYARYYAASGFSVLIYDHANFGLSPGQPRQHIDPTQQLADLGCAVEFLQTQPLIDDNRIGLWGTSLSGGHVLALAAQDSSNRIKAVVAQTPFINGEENARRALNHNETLLKKQQRVLAHDAKRIAQGHPAGYIAVAASSPNTPTVLNDSAAWNFFNRANGWQPTVTLQSVASVSHYQPAQAIEDIHCPVMFQLTEQDQVNHTDLQLAAFQLLQTRKQLLMLAGGHFSIYDQHRFHCLHAARKFFMAFI